MHTSHDERQPDVGASVGSCTFRQLKAALPRRQNAGKTLSPAFGACAQLEYSLGDVAR
jgi:hypothetical protein